MPEAFAVLFVGVVCAGIFIFAKLQAFSPQANQRANERERLAREIAWLEERLALSEREAWHDDMREPIAERLAEARTQAAALAER
jgi:hypothetical protein